MCGRNRPSDAALFRRETPPENYLFDRRPGALRPERGLQNAPLVWIELHDGEGRVRLVAGWGGVLLLPESARALAQGLLVHAELAENPGSCPE